MYQLKTPIKSRQKGADIEITELALPEVVTVGMMAAAQRQSGTDEAMAHNIDMAASISGLDPFTAAKLSLADALGYLEALKKAGLLGRQEGVEPEFIEPIEPIELPVIKPLRSSLKGVTATHFQPVELALQVLEKSGNPRAQYLSIDIRAFMPPASVMLMNLIDPK